MINFINEFSGLCIYFEATILHLIFFYLKIDHFFKYWINQISKRKRGVSLIETLIDVGLKNHAIAM